MYFSRLADEVQLADEAVNTRLAYKTIRLIYGKCSTCSEWLNNFKRQPIADSNDKIEAWASHFVSLLNNPVNDSADINPRVSDVFAKVDNSAPNSAGVTLALKALKTGKAAGADQLTLSSLSLQPTSSHHISRLCSGGYGLLETSPVNGRTPLLSLCTRKKTRPFAATSGVSPSW